MLLRSQLALPVDLRAQRSFGADATHTGLLTDPTTRELVVDLVAEHATPRGAGGNPFTRLGDVLGGVLGFREADE